MIVVRNLSKGNIRINLDSSKRFLIKAGGIEEVPLPNEVEKLNFYKDLVKSKALEVVKKSKDKDDEKAEGKAEDKAEQK